MRRFAFIACCGLALPLSGAAAAPSHPHLVARPDHVIVVMMENKDYADIVGNTDPDSGAPFINALIPIAANFTDSHGIVSAGEPNYLALFSGDTQGVVGNETPPHLPLGTANLGAQLLDAGFTFAQYAEGLPSDGFLGTAQEGYAGPYGTYYPSENVAVWWSSPATPQPAGTLPPSVMRTLQSFPTDYSQLPTVAFVHATDEHNMHNDSIAHGDDWLRLQLSGYAQWAMTHNSLLILTWDASRGDAPDTNHIATLFVGPMLTPGDYAQTINHYNVLRTLEDLFGLAYAGAAADAASITDIWNSAAPQPIVSLDHPGNLSNGVAGTPIALSASVNANGRSINKVQFYNSATLLGEADQAPYTYNWSNPPAGIDALTAAVEYDGSRRASSAPVYITLTAPLVPVDTTALVTYLAFDDSLDAQAGATSASVLTGTAHYAAGKFGRAARFGNGGGSGSPSDWAASLGNLDSVYAGDFTLSLWTTSASTTDAGIFGNKDWTSGSNPGWVIATTTNKSVNWNTVGGARHDVDLSFTDGAWHLINVSVDRTQNQVVVYLDGVAKSTGPLGSVGTASLGAGFDTLIGSSGNGTYSGTADIDDLAIWSRALSAAEISNLYRGGAAGEPLLSVGQSDSIFADGFE